MHMEFTAEQISFMREAIRLSEENARSGKGGPFGAVVVKEGRIIASGVNEVTATNDPTAHAEMTAIRKACKLLGTFQLEGCDIYASCEPCPMCLSAIYWARTSRLFYANNKEDAASIFFDDDFIYREINRDESERSIPTMQLLREEAKAAFDIWHNNPHKVRY